VLGGAAVLGTRGAAVLGSRGGSMSRSVCGSVCGSMGRRMGGSMGGSRGAAMIGGGAPVLRSRGRSMGGSRGATMLGGGGAPMLGGGAAVLGSRGRASVVGRSGTGTRSRTRARRASGLAVGANALSGIATSGRTIAAAGNLLVGDNGVVPAKSGDETVHVVVHEVEVRSISVSVRGARLGAPLLVAVEGAEVGHHDDDGVGVGRAARARCAVAGGGELVAHATAAAAPGRSRAEDLVASRRGVSAILPRKGT